MSMHESDPAHDGAEGLLPLITGAVAHELKQPLSVAWGYTELLLEAPPSELDPTTLRCLHEIDASLRRMHEVINRLQHATVPPLRQPADDAERRDLDMSPAPLPA